MVKNGMMIRGAKVGGSGKEGVRASWGDRTKGSDGQQGEVLCRGRHGRRTHETRARPSDPTTGGGSGNSSQHKGGDPDVNICHPQADRHVPTDQSKFNKIRTYSLEFFLFLGV